MKNQLKDIKDKMIEALEGPYRTVGKYKNILSGDYICHEDIPEETPIGFDAHFTVCGEHDDKFIYLVLIQKIEQ